MLRPLVGAAALLGAGLPIRNSPPGTATISNFDVPLGAFEGRLGVVLDGVSTLATRRGGRVGGHDRRFGRGGRPGRRGRRRRRPLQCGMGRCMALGGAVVIRPRPARPGEASDTGRTRSLFVCRRSPRRPSSRPCSPSRSRSAEPSRFEFSQPHMGTTFRVVLYAADEKRPRRRPRRRSRGSADSNGIMSDYHRHERIDAVVCRLRHGGRQAGQGRATTCSPC